MWKIRSIYLAIAAVLIVAAFATRAGWPWIPRFVADYGGDTLWALMVFVVLRALAPRRPPIQSALAALAIAYLCELSQLYHATWIEAVRSYRLGGILLGYVFSWSDLVCYTVGILAGLAVEWSVRRP
jgi:hypothetical protein